jgi:hypothetical protein
VVKCLFHSNMQCNRKKIKEVFAIACCIMFPAHAVGVTVHQDGRGVSLGNDDANSIPIGCFFIKEISGLLGRWRPMRYLVTFQGRDRNWKTLQGIVNKYPWLRN